MADIEVKRFACKGRELAVEFTCRRCNKKAYRLLKECMNNEFNSLTDLKPPSGWKDGGFDYPLFCPECKVAYERFMNME